MELQCYLPSWCAIITAVIWLLLFCEPRKTTKFHDLTKDVSLEWSGVEYVTIA
jgi:hypothetical protein